MVVDLGRNESFPGALALRVLILVLVLIATSMLLAVLVVIAAILIVVAAVRAVVVVAAVLIVVAAVLIVIVAILVVVVIVSIWARWSLTAVRARRSLIIRARRSLIVWVGLRWPLSSVLVLLVLVLVVLMWVIVIVRLRRANEKIRDGLLWDTLALLSWIKRVAIRAVFLALQRGEALTRLFVPESAFPALRVLVKARLLTVRVALKLSRRCRILFFLFFSFFSLSSLLFLAFFTFFFFFFNYNTRASLLIDCFILQRITHGLADALTCFLVKGEGILAHHIALFGFVGVDRWLSIAEVLKRLIAIIQDGIEFRVINAPALMAWIKALAAWALKIAYMLVEAHAGIGIPEETVFAFLLVGVGRRRRRRLGVRVVVL